MRIGKQTLAFALFALAVLPTLAWSGGHDTVGRCILKKLPDDWRTRFRPEWTNAFLEATHLPDNGDPKLFKSEELAWLRANAGLGESMSGLHRGEAVCGEITRLVNALRTGDDYSVFIYLASISHSIADGAACNHDAIIHLVTYTWTPEGSPDGCGLPVLPKTGRELPIDFAFVERDADTQLVLDHRLAALRIPEPPTDVTLRKLFENVSRWEVFSMECDSRNSGRILASGMKWYATGDSVAKRDVADALSNLGLWSVERTLWVFHAARILAARPDFAPLPAADVRQLLETASVTNHAELMKRPMANDSFARPYFAEPGRPSRVCVMYSPIDYGHGSVFSPLSRAVGCQIVGSLKRSRPELNASLMDARVFAQKGLDPKETPVVVVFRRVSEFRGFDAKGFDLRLRAYVRAGGKVIWINGTPPDYLIGGETLSALRDVGRESDNSYCKPQYPVPMDELMSSSLAWTGPVGEKREWKYVHRPINRAGWHWVGSPQWFEPSQLPKDTVPLTELRTPGKTYLTGVASGSCAYLPLNAVFAYCLTDERPELDPFVLRLDSAGESILFSTLQLLLKERREE